ncbi:MAG: hypothetical protein ACD_76C00035G0001 [uncultured bacterium]|nr:MAG: hypothetical protein ACD_76C00035G0001 [uncultured bacterium]HBD05361.1 thioredoxin [Candidatus Uhrbacteria bacterium]
MLHEFSSKDFDSEVIASSEPVFVDFWAPWCGPCKMMGPIVEELAGEMTGIKIGKLNVDENQDIAQQHNIMSIPTFIVFKNGQAVDQFSGAISKDDLKNKISRHL